MQALDTHLQLWRSTKSNQCLPRAKTITKCSTSIFFTVVHNFVTEIRFILQLFVYATHNIDSMFQVIHSVYGILDDEFDQPIEGSGIWTKSEHARFLMAMELYPQGPWKKVADIVQTRSIRQVLSHAQKYRQKIARRQRGLKTKAVVPQAQTVQRTACPLSLESLNPGVIEANVDCQNELPTLPNCLDFLLDLMATVDPIKIEGH